MMVYLVLFSALGVLSISPVIVRLAQTSGLPSTVLAAGRLLIAGTVLTPFIFKHYLDDLRALTKREWVMVVSAGCLMGLNGATVIISLESSSVLINQVLASTSPLWVILIEVLLIKTHFRFAVWVGLGCVLIGSSVVAFGSQQSIAGASHTLIGDALALLSAIFGALYLVTGRQVRRTLRTIPYLWVVYWIGGLVGMLLVAARGEAITGHSAEAYRWLLIAGLGIQLFGVSGFAYALAHFSATIVSLISRSLVFLSAFWAFLIFKEIPSPAQFAGSVIILAGVAVAVLGQERTS
jgi:drug/metabolite transporter (DMT)-like permease